VGFPVLFFSFFFFDGYTFLFILELRS